MAKTTGGVIVANDDQAIPDTDGPGASNARAVRNPDRPAPATLRPGLTSTAGSAAEAETAQPVAPRIPATRPPDKGAKKVTKRGR